MLIVKHGILRAMPRPPTENEMSAEFRRVWPLLPAGYVEHLKMQWIAALRYRHEGRRHPDEDSLIFNLTARWFAAFLPGPPRESMKLFFNAVVTGVSPEMEVFRDAFLEKSSELLLSVVDEHTDLDDTVRYKPGWYTDSERRHELRWFDGQCWTDHVSDRGVQAVDRLPDGSGGKQ